MKPTHTAIATALAVAVVAFFFMFNGFAFFSPSTIQSDQNLSADSAIPTNNPIVNPTINMPTNIPESVTELQMKDEVVGTGAVAVAGDTVTVNYVGALTNGKVFDASASHPETASGFTFNLGAGQVIKGWDQGVAGMKVGGKRLLIIPASLAYGSQEVGDSIIPANSTLVFEVELLKVQK